ncbi:MAG: type VI secretion system tip protein VgrG [Pirellulaceae bacterium]|nr:type VI secretion system tip protein VgrG [Pirellulaceae bacterium]
MAGERIHQIFGVLEKDVIFRHMTCSEHLGAPYLYQVELLSEKKDISPYTVVGKSMSVGILRDGQPPKYYHGLVTGFQNEGTAGGYQLYTAQLRPRLWLLKHAYDCRIFQQSSVPQILEEIIKTKHSISDYRLKLQNTYQPREYCVQYRESDFDFVSRLMEQEGIYYFFEHLQSKHTLVLSDDVAAHQPIEGDGQLLYRPPNEVAASDEHVFQWQHHVDLHTRTFVYRDFDYNKPKSSLEARSESRQSAARLDTERYDYPGEYVESAEGSRYLKILASGTDSSHIYLRGQAHSYRLGVGALFKLVDHPNQEENGDYLVVAAESAVHSGEIEQFQQESKNFVDIKFRAIPKNVQYRSTRVTPQPIIAGPQTATVVGQSNQEIWTDNLGRIKVQFHWDRLGKNDESSSCWIRVAQMWSGKSWGSMYIPRIGQEVVVEFMEGDPDRPLVTGSVYNTDQTVPYDLPENEKHCSGIRSRSTPEGDNQSFNELRFEDKKDEELVYLHAEKNFKRVVENSDETSIGFEKKDPGDQVVKVFGNQTLNVGCGESDGSQTVEIYKNQTETIKTGNRSITVESGNDSLKVTQGNLTIDITAGECSVTAGQKIELKVGSSSIVIESAKITLKSPQISIEADMKAEVKGAMIDANASGVMKLQGGMVKIN